MRKDVNLLFCKSLQVGQVYKRWGLWYSSTGNERKVVIVSQDRVYAALAKCPGEYLSGEELSRELGITRAAVWKAVEALRHQGYEIEARTGRGYCLKATQERLGQREIAAYLGQERLNWQVCGEVDSTNSLCKRLAMEGAPDGTAVIADCQSAGRGRRGRSFQSPAGLGLYFSILWRPEVPPQALLSLPALGAVAACRAIEDVCGVRPEIKWPNDLVFHGKKLGGILTEMAMENESDLVEYVVLGIGINVGQRREDFTGEVADMASSLEVELGQKVSRPRLAAALLRQMDKLRLEALYSPEQWLAEYRRSCLTLGAQVQIIAGAQRSTAMALDVDEEYGLVVCRADGTVETVRSGEVSVRGLYGYVPGGA